MAFDLGGFLKKRWDTSVIKDAVSANTAADQQRRQVTAVKMATPARPNVPYYGSFSPQVTNQDQAVQQSGRNLGRQQREGQITGQQFNDKFSQLLASTTKDAGYKTPVQQATGIAKGIAKPFWETGDTVVKGAQLGLANVTNNTQAADNARARRDQSYRDSIVAPVSRAYNQVSETPVGNIIPGNAARKNTEKQIENKLIDLEKNTDSFTTNKTKEIADGIRSGIYDPQKGQEAIQQLLSVNQEVNDQLGRFYNQKLEKAGFNKDMTAAQMYAQSFGDLASTAGLVISPTSGAALKAAGGSVIKNGLTELGTNSVLNALGGGASAYGQGANLNESLKAAATNAVVGAALMGVGYIKAGLKGPAAVDTNVPAAPGSLRERIQSAKNDVRLAISNPDGADTTTFKISNPLDAKTTGLDINNPMGAQTKPLKISNPMGADTGKKLSIMDRYRQATDIDAPGQDGFIRLPGGKNDPAPRLSTEQKTFLNDYAEMLEGMDADKSGGMLIPDGEAYGGGYKRSTSHSKFYSDTFAEKGRAPSKLDWFNEAKRQIDSGKAAFGASEDYKAVPKKTRRVNKPISQPVDDLPVNVKRVTNDSVNPPAVLSDKKLVQLSKQEQLPQQLVRTVGQAKSPQLLQNDSLTNSTTKVKLNTDRLNTTGGYDAMARLDKATQETITKMSNKDVQRVAKDAGIDTKTYTDEQVRTKIAEQLNVRQDAVRLQNEADAAFKAGDLKTAEEKLARSAAMGRVSREQGTDLARQLQARRIIANELDTPQQRMFKLLDNAGVNPEVYVKRLAKVDFSDPTDVVKAYRELVPAKAGDWLDTVRYNSMLSSPLTHIVNTASNAINVGIVAPLEKTLRGVADATGGLFGKERKYAAGEGAAYAKGAAINLKKAAGEFLDVMRGIDRTQNLDLQEYSTPLAIGGVKGATYSTLSFPMKMLGASDKFFRTLAEGGETSALNLRESKGIKIKGNKQALAKAEGAYRLYQQDTDLRGQGGILQSIDSVTNSIMKLRKDHTWARFVFPFVKTPTNILKQGVEFSPLGFANAVTAADKATALTRAAIGTAVFGASAAALGAGDLTWGTPTNANERDRFLAEGKQPYAIRIGGKWVGFSKLPPAVSFPLALTAGIDDAIKQKKMSESTADAILEGVAKWGQFLGDQSYVKNIGDTLAAFKGDSDRAVQAVSNYPQQVVPFRALTGWIARMSDDTERKVDTSKGNIDKQVQSLMLNYPGLRQKVGTRDYKGQPIPANNPILNSFAPFKITDQRATNPIDAELDANKAAPKTSLLTPRQTADIEKITATKVGEYQKQLIDSDEYKALSSEDKRKRLATLAEDVKVVENRKYQTKYAIGERALDFKGKETVLSKNQVNLLLNGDITPYKTGTSSAGKVETPKDVDSSNRDLTMTRAKASNDLNTWKKVAGEEFTALDKQIKELDPKTDQVKINTLTKKKEALEREAKTYLTNGYIKKPKTATGKGGRGGKISLPANISNAARSSTFTNLNRLLAGTTKTNSNRKRAGGKATLNKITVRS
jgi:hypothetical protein